MGIDFHPIGSWEDDPFNDIIYDIYYCEYCHTKSKNDSNGNCANCGAKRKTQISFVGPEIQKRMPEKRKSFWEKLFK
jgi:hypothetical protein